MLRLPRIPSAMRYAVVIGILMSLCAGVLLPSIANAREAAKRSVCVCHIHCLGYGVLIYASSHQERLPGYSNWSPLRPNPLPRERRLSWQVDLLPFIGQDPTAKLFDISAADDDPKNRAGMEERLYTLTCPSSGERSGSGQTVHWKSPGPVTHYVSVAGVGTNAAELNLTNAGAGMFGYEPRWGISNIPDGNSNTMMLFESALDPGHWAKCGPSTIRGIDPTDVPFVGEGRPIGGFHPGSHSWFRRRSPSANIVMADGSSRHLTNRISPEVLAALVTANGRESVPNDW